MTEPHPLLRHSEATYRTIPGPPGLPSNLALIMRRPQIQFLWWRDCPSWERALEMLREEVEAAGLDPEAIEVSEIDTDEDAEPPDFPGSPTIRLDGEDFQPLAPMPRAA